ncbi:MAG TPA: helix-turn-helix domain-containing protein [archaeon]|mgnify:FL=1|nr:helix-turn-helix domain-containing protein [archaeon]HPV66495.1 helix-turn-helix domain-containing protein [archaeon]
MTRTNINNTLLEKITTDDQELINYFEEIGFRKNHAIVYLVFLKYGSLYLPEIVKKTGINRSYMYDILNELTEKGLIGYILKNKNRIYYADNPNKIIDLINNKEKTIAKFRKRYKELLPSFVSSNIITTKESVIVFDGKLSLKNIFEDIIAENKNMLCFGGDGEFSKYYPTYVNSFTKRLNKINYKIIYTSNLRKSRPLKIQKNHNFEIRFMPKGYQLPFAIWVYGDKTAIVIWESMIGIVIKNKNTAEGFEDYFDIIWKVAKE